MISTGTFVSGWRKTVVTARSFRSSAILACSSTSRLARSSSPSKETRSTETPEVVSSEIPSGRPASGGASGGDIHPPPRTRVVI